METSSSEPSSASAAASTPATQAAATATPTSPKEKKYYIDTTFITPPREGVEMISPLKDGLGKEGREGGDGGREVYICHWREILSFSLFQ